MTNPVRDIHPPTLAQRSQHPFSIGENARLKEVKHDNQHSREGEN